MLDSFLESNEVKRISHQYTFFYKNIFPFFIGFLCVVAGVLSYVGGNYLFLIFAFAIFIVLVIAATMAYKIKIADEAYLDYKSKEFILLYKKSGKKIRKKFIDLVSVREMAFGQTIEVDFGDGEKYIFYSSQTVGPAPNYSVYKEIKFILDNRLGDFLTE
jgi:hypothetical protein